MSLLYDLTATQPSGASAFTGGNEYAKAVFLRLVERSLDKIIAFSDPERPLDPVIAEAVRKVEHVETTWGKGVQRLLDRQDVVTFYSALPPLEVLDQDLKNVHWRFTLHGLRPYELPTDPAARWMANSVPEWSLAVVKSMVPKMYRRRVLGHYRRLLSLRSRSVRVSVPSAHTKYALLSALPEVDPTTVEVTYSPLKSVDCRLTEAETRKAVAEVGVVPGRYVLVLSGDRWLKNGLRAAMALDKLYDTRPDLPITTLVLGVQNRRRYLRRIKHPERIVLSRYVAAPVLEALYSKAFALLYPSLNEGFGYPPLECMKYGVPVICGAVTSVPEVCADAALYVDPRSEDEIGARILQLILDSTCYSDYGDRGRSRARLVARQQEAMLDRFLNSLIA